MRITSGVDIVHIPTFETRVHSGGDLAPERIWTQQELNRMTGHVRAGLFAAKEAVIKATRLGVGAWHAVEIVHDNDGKPSISLSGVEHPASSDVSIAHHGEYAVAVAVCVYE